jgi:site-specific DNA-cytosine methylase
MIGKIDFESQSRKSELIESILNIKRQEANENINENQEIKLGRRLEQRSYEKLSKEILEHIITRYEIDNKKLPTKENLIDLMINFLGNIQKTPDYYNLKNGKKKYYYEY